MSFFDSIYFTIPAFIFLLVVMGGYQRPHKTIGNLFYTIVTCYNS
jgi:hypothetical protein